MPADLRLLKTYQVTTNNFALTGESTPSPRQNQSVPEGVPLAERHSMAYMGTSLATGSGLGVIVETGMQTELGKIASLSEESKPGASPLQLEIRHLAGRITLGTLVLVAILAPISLFANIGINESFVFAIGIAAAMIPQGLAAEVNVALSQAARKLAKARALVKRLTAVETLGATQIICTDKTGTLTKNEMTVTHFWFGGNEFDVTGVGFSPTGKISDLHGKIIEPDELKQMQEFFNGAKLANNASIHSPDSKHNSWYCVGDPTEGALVSLALKSHTDKNIQSHRIDEFAFDSDRKRMSVVVNESGNKKLYAKGSPESVMAVCDRILLDGKVVKINNSHRRLIQKYSFTMAEQALRNIAIAYDTLEGNPKNAEAAERNLIFLGVATMIDPPREEIPEAISAAKRGHMKVAIITGDEARTATAIAERIGFGTRESLKTISPSELSKLSAAQSVELIVSGKAVFARVSPIDKLHIVDTLKRAGYIVAVTGDGVNDAPALKRADIGVAMGKIGTDVAKEAAEIVLLDDSFHTLVKAIEYGRVVFQNIKKATLSCLTSNAGELVVVLISLGAVSLLGIPIAITAIQILAIDLMAELFPIAALGWDPPTEDIMDDPPREIKQHILNKRAIIDLILGGLVIGMLAYWGYIASLLTASQSLTSPDPIFYAKATTVAYLTIALCQYGTVLSRRTARGKSLFSSYLWSNPRLLVAIGFSFISVLAIIYIPFLADYLGNAPLTLQEWWPAIISALVYLGLREFVKVKFRLTAS